jgi:hypothetical protein
MAVLVALCLASQTYGASVAWNGAAGDNAWQNALNWSGNQLPREGDDVVVARENFNLYVNTSVTVRGLALSPRVNLYVSGTGVVFTATGACHLDGANMEVHNGATLSLPGLSQYTAGSVTNDYVNWQSWDAGSLLDLPGLTNLAGSPDPWMMQILSRGGGHVKLGGQFSILSGAVRLMAYDTNSVLEAAGLRRLAPNYCDVAANDGGRISLPGLAEYVGANASRGNLYWTSSGPGSVLEVSGLTNIIGAPEPWENVFEAGNGGRITLGGRFSILSGGVRVNVSDTNSTFEAPGFQRLAPHSYSLNAQAGARVSLPGLAELSGTQTGGGSAWLVCVGTGSLLELPGLTNFAGSPYPGMTYVRAQEGGRLVLGGAFSLVAGRVDLTANGTNSVLEAPGLQQLAPNYCNVAANLGGQVLFSGLKEWLGENIDRDGARWSSSGAGSYLEAAHLTNFTGSLRPLEAQVFATAGGRVKLDGAFSILKGGVNWAAMDPDSLLEAPGLRRLAPSFSYLHAENGGRLSLPALAEYAGNNPDRGGYYWYATGAGSVLTVSGLTNFVGTTAPWVTELRATQGGQLRLGGSFSLPTGGVFIDVENTNSVFEAPGLQRLTPSSLSLNVQAGARVSLPGLVEWAGAPTRGASASLVCAGTGSLLELPGLTNLVASLYPGITEVQAQAGGRLILGGAFSILAGRVNLEANGPNSVLEAPGLQQLAPNYCSIAASLGGRVSLSGLRQWRGENIERDNPNWTSAGAGSVLEATNLTGFSGAARPLEVLVSAQAGGYLKLGGGFSIVTGGVSLAAIASNSVLEAPGLARLAANYSGLRAENGGRLSLPGLREFSGANPDRGTFYWSAIGAGSVLETPGLTNFAGSPEPWVSLLTARSGARLTLGGQYSIASGGVAVESADTNSVFEAPGLRRVAAEYFSIGVSGGAQVTLPDLQDYVGDAAERQDVAWDCQGAGSTMSVPSLRNFSGSPFPWTLRVSARLGGKASLGGSFDILTGGLSFYAQGAGSVVEAPALRRLGPSSFGIGAEEGGRVSLPGLVEYSAINSRLDSVYLTAAGNGSVIDMPAVSSFVAPQPPQGIHLSANGGGQINLGTVPAINSGIVYITADGTGSRVDLHSLGRFDELDGYGNLQALNGGSIALAAILASRGVEMTTLAAWGAPAVSASASPSLIVSATPGLSFVVETRPVGGTDKDWQRRARIPVVANQNVLGPIPGDPAQVEFRVRELVANPPELELGTALDGSTRLTVFGLPGATYRLDVSPDVFPKAVWTPDQQVTLTHSFLQLDFTPAAPAMQFYRAVRQ